MQPADHAGQIVARLLEGGDPARAAAESAYLKLDLPFAGVGVPACRRIARSFLAGHPLLDRGSVLALAGELWEAELFEAKRVAVELLVMRAAALQARDLAVVERLIRTSYTWALVDDLAIRVGGVLVDEHGSCADRLDHWSVDDDFWIRRSALLALYQGLRAGGGDADRFFRYAEGMLDEREFFIRKAIGWVLRDLGKQQPELVRDWLLPRAARASGLTIREAVKWLPPEAAEEIRAAHAAPANSR